MRLAILLSALLAAAADPPNPWALLAQNDVREMHAQILAHHPGPVDKANPAFAEWLESGYAKAMAKAAAVRTYGGYVYALRFYGAGFRDGHVNAGVMLSGAPLAWPGFAVALRGDKYVVLASSNPADASLPPAGAEIVDCDGRTPRAIVEQDIWPYTMGPVLEAGWRKIAPSLLLDGGNPWKPRPSACRFKSGESIVTMPLRYRETSSAEIAKVTATAAAVLAPQPPARPLGDGVWVRIPSFYDADEATLQRLETLVELAPEWRKAAFVVFDVRGNEGGNSAWGNRIVSALYGDAFVNDVVEPKFAGQYVDWRLSKENVAHVRSFVESTRERQGPDAPAVKYWSDLANEMEAALARGESLYHRNDDDEARKPETPAPPLFNGRVVLLTDSACASACLDFADKIRALPRSTHAGLSTSADSVYMEVRSVTLPSGIGRLGMPVKVYRNRPRGHNTPYVPDQPYGGDINDTAALETWITTRVLP